MVRILKHNEVDENTLLDIVYLKSLSWNYSIEQHLSWIQQNIRDEDLHFLMYDNNILVGYLNLVDVFVDNDNDKIPFLGVGNVCTKNKGKGDGLRLMRETNHFLQENGFKGLLFCKQQLVKFYEKSGWRIIKNIYPDEKVMTMDFNNLFETSGFTYNDRLF